MDLRLFARVLWRFKYLVAAGVIVASALAVLTIANVDLSHGAPKLSPRTKPLYGSSATLLITQSGFPWGSAVQQYATSGNSRDPVPAGDLSRLTGLANLYVQLANSDIIKGLLVRSGAPAGQVSAIQSYSISPSYYSTALPILTLSGISGSRANALAVTQAGVDALTGYLKQQQRAAGIAQSQRVVVQELQRPQKTVVVNSTKKTLPIVVFLTVMLAVTGLAFVLENLLPRPPEETAVSMPETDPVLDSARRTA